MSELVTFVFTDLVGSVDLKRRMPGSGATERDLAYVEQVLKPHRERIEQGLVDSRGRVVSTAGDGHFLAFTDSIRAARWAIDVQRSHEDDPLMANGSPETTARVRIGLHVGVPQIDPSDNNNFIGRAVDYAARLADRAGAGQILLSRSAASLLEDAGLDGVKLYSHGMVSLRGIGDVEVHEVLYSRRSPGELREEQSKEDKREWTVLPMTMGLTEYSAQALSNAASSNVLSSTSAPVKRVGNYELIDLIGAGGMGNVYRARHTLFGRTRAVKIIKPELVASGGESVVQRFYKEIQATGSLEHPNLVVAIESSTPEDDLHFLVMEYIEGIGADELISRSGALKIADACEICRQAALGLAHLHGQGLVHRDIKPSNIMLTCADEQSASTSTPERMAVAKLMDLGLALLVGEDQQRLTRLDQGGMGTGHYMSPEQWRTTTVDIRADIYSLGCTLYHLLHGAPPFADSDLKPQLAHEREPLPPMRVDLPRELGELICRLLAKSPEERPQLPLEVARALAPFASGHSLVGLIDQQTAATRLAGHNQYDTLSPGQVELDTFIPRRRDQAHQDSEDQLPTRRRLLAATAITAGAAAVGLGWFAKNLHEQNQARRRIALENKATDKAALMGEQILKRFRELEVLAKNPDLIGWLEALDQSPDNVELRKAPQSWLTDAKLSRDSNYKSNSWFLTDSRGIQVARAPSKNTIGKSYAYRDYFHGGGHMTQEEAAQATEPILPIREQHHSRVYKSTKENVLKVAFSVPVWNQGDGDKSDVIGVLAMSVALGDFSALEENENSNSLIEIVLADTRADYVDKDEAGNEVAMHGLILHHKLLDQYGEGHPRLPGDMLKQIAAKRTIDKSRHFPDYKDLLGRPGLWYGGCFSNVMIQDKPTGWVIIAQERH